MNNAVAAQHDEKDQIWFKQDNDQTQIGFTENFLSIVRECWHVVPAVKEKVTEKSPLMAIETNDALLTVFSPRSGNIISFSEKAQNFPDKLTSSDVVCVIADKKATTARQAARQAEPVNAREDEMQAVFARIREQQAAAARRAQQIRPLDNDEWPEFRIPQPVPPQRNAGGVNRMWGNDWGVQAEPANPVPPAAAQPNVEPDF